MRLCIHLYNIINFESEPNLKLYQSLTISLIKSTSSRLSTLVTIGTLPLIMSSIKKLENTCVTAPCTAKWQDFFNSAIDFTFVNFQ